jgi:alkylation response protein AidB-like acyl-CoA dehydrogenase
VNFDSLVASAGQSEFHLELREFLDSILPDGRLQLPRDPAERLRVLRDWQAAMAEGGWAGIHWPVEYGGRDATLAQNVVYNVELTRRGLPAFPGHRGLALVGPGIIAHGTEEQKARYLPKIRTAEELWAGGFSEPDAGSDLASLRTRADIDGDTVVINGQKIWTSQAARCDMIYTLVRTDATGPKHQGITVVLVPLHSPGVTVRPIRQISGARGFCEVFFDDVSVPTANILGPVGDGWRVNRTTMAHEHFTNFIPAQARYSRTLDQVVALARSPIAPGGARPGDDPHLRNRVGRAWADSQMLLVNGLRNLARVTAGGMPGPEGSIAKLFGQEFEKAMHELALDITGPAGVLDRGADGTPERGRWLFGYLAARATTIGGGTSEIHRGKIAEQVLGLPRDPWNEHEDL